MMLGSKMIPLWALALVTLICGLTAAGGAAVGPAAISKSDCNQKTCLDIEDDIRQATCCENQLYPGEGLWCCGGQAFNPEEATCCEVQDEYNTTAVTEGLSQKVSNCCGLKAYNQLNEICCESTVIAKPVPNAKCCGTRAYDEDTHLCCGPSSDKSILLKNSIDHLCCGHDQFNTRTECCCPKTLSAQPISSSCCQEVSAYCGTQAYNKFHELCCQSTVVAKLTPNAECCGKRAYDEDTHLCCGLASDQSIPLKNSIDHRCCGHDQFNTRTECCCPKTLAAQPISSSCCQEASAYCGTMAYNKFHELCCQTTVVTKFAPNAECCGKWAYDEDTQLCCGPGSDKTILTKISNDHLCCGHKQFNPKTERCCRKTLKIHPIGPTCCQEESGVQKQKPAPQPNCTEPNTSLCGSSCYNPSHLSCCEKKQGNSKRCCATGPCVDVAPAVYNPHTHFCCDGCVSEWKLWKDQFHGSSGKHRRGREVYWPHTEICCDGHRHPKRENTHCCGPKAYNIRDPQTKCCKGTLHTLTTGHEAQCCGSILLSPSNVCCSSEDMEVLYSAKTGFGCCGHLYYNATLWSCSAGKLSPAQKPGQHQGLMIKESTRLSVNNVNEADLCEEIQIGIVESESLHSVVFSSVLRINGRRGTVVPLDSRYILKIPDGWSSPPLTPGKTYFFDKVNVFTDFSHDSIQQSLHFFMSKCYRPVATTN